MVALLLTFWLGSAAAVPPVEPAPSSAPADPDDADAADPDAAAAGDPDDAAAADPDDAAAADPDDAAAGDSAGSITSTTEEADASAPTPALSVTNGDAAPEPTEAAPARAGRLPSFVANQDKRHGLGVHPHEAEDRHLGQGLEAHAWARVGYHALIEDGDVAHGPYLGMARLQVRISDAERLSAFVQLGADRGELTLLDAKMRARVSERFLLAVGRMKVPVSHDFMVPASQMLLPTRALLDGLSPQRAIGAMGRFRHEGRRSVTTVRAGVFDPMDPLDHTLAGPQVVGQIGVHTRGGFFVHGATAAWLPGKEVSPQALAAGPVWDRQLDGALGWSDEAWTFEGEALVARPIVQTGTWDYGATLLAARRLPIGSSRFVLEPVFAGDIRAWQDRLLRGTLAVNLHEDGWHLLETLAWEVSSVGGGRPGHRLLVQVQAGL